MAEYIATAAQALANVGDSVKYTTTVVPGCCNIKHRAGSGNVLVRNTGTWCNPSRYRVQFHGNITNTAVTTQLSIYLDGEELPETLMSVTPAAATDVWSVGSDTEFTVSCCCAAVSVRTLTAGVTVDTAEIIVTKVT